jgi:uncharacterized protein YcfJ
MQWPGRPRAVNQQRDLFHAVTGAARRRIHREDFRMTDRTTIERETITDDGVERREKVEKEYAPGAPDDGDEQVGGAVAGGVGGAALGAVVGGPVGAVVGGAIGATAGATAGLVDEETKDDEEVVVEREETRW